MIGRFYFRHLCMIQMIRKQNR